jgi:hypothetical protein
MQLVDISSVGGGIGPYEIYVCDPAFVYCEYVDLVGTFPYSFTLTPPLEGAPAVIVKFIDTSTGCEKFKYQICESVKCSILTEIEFPIKTEDGLFLVTEDCTIP